MKAKYVIHGVDESIGIVWETKLGLILVLNSPNINIQNGMTIHDLETRDIVKQIDTLEVFFKLLPCCRDDIFTSIDNVKDYRDIADDLKDRFE